MLSANKSSVEMTRLAMFPDIEKNIAFFAGKASTNDKVIEAELFDLNANPLALTVLLSFAFRRLASQRTCDQIMHES